MSIVEPGPNDEFFIEFLDDYFAECDEHLRLVRRDLLALEGCLGAPRPDRSLVDELFRSFHSLKGISGMVGVREAEQIAHEMESYLRALRDNKVALTPKGIEALVAGTKMLEQVIAERRAKAPASDITAVLAQIATVTEDGASGPAQPSDGRAGAGPLAHALAPDENAKLAEALARGKKVWCFEFAPTPELAGRGINVNSIRARLQEAGELIHAAPRVKQPGGITFEFLVASDEDGQAFDAWRGDGLQYSAYATPEGATAPAEAEPGGHEAPAPQQSALLAPSNIVRVDMARLDVLMRVVGELVISRSRLDDNLKRLEARLDAPEWRPLQEINVTMERQIRDMREAIMKVRMVPVGEIFERMQFVIRDLAREYDKQIDLELSGQQTQIDKLLVERMMDPILHLVRNAVSHGLEPAAERVAAGKPPRGKISLSASTAAEMVVIEIEDDGRGIDADRVAARARQKGLINENAGLDSSTLLDLICAPGFSTREEADRASGRGVGMSVVKSTVSGLGGSLELSTQSGLGTRFTIQLPLTLAIADALIVSVGGHRFAVPQSAVREVIEVEAAAVKQLENNEIISHRGGALPLLRLARLFQLEERAGATFHALVIGSGLNAVGVAVDRISGQREIVVQAITDPLLEAPGIAGATELGDGRAILILDAEALAEIAGKRRGARPGRKPGEERGTSHVG